MPLFCSPNRQIVGCAAGLLLLVLLLNGCAEKRDQARQFDQTVEENYLKGHVTGTATDFLTRGGAYSDATVKQGGDSFDRAHVLPLLQQLERELNLKPIAVCHPQAPQLAMAIVAELPPTVSHARVRELLEQAQLTFPGEILLQTGDRWIGLDFWSQEDAEALSQ